ncbi:MAG: phosphatidylglycerophosphatase A [Phycisphaerales bacterium]|nr:phosphatidylglycerophosphatase A [Phycisphaerales bacterium]
MGDRLRTLALTSGGLGFMRPAPGTWGSLPPPAAAFLLVLVGAPRGAIDGAMLAFVLVGSAACLALGSWGETRFGRKDASHIVADETAGQALVLMFLPLHAISTPLRAMLTMGGAFILFRVFDIIKPPPARGLQRLKGGLGVLIDDLLAGLYAAILLQAIVRLAWPAISGSGSGIPS